MQYSLAVCGTQDAKEVHFSLAVCGTQEAKEVHFSLAVCGAQEQLTPRLAWVQFSKSLLLSGYGAEILYRPRHYYIYIILLVSEVLQKSF